MTIEERKHWSEVAHPHMAKVIDAKPEDDITVHQEQYTNVVVNLGDVDAYLYLYHLVEGRDPAIDEVLNKTFALYLGIKYWRSTHEISAHMIDNLCAAIDYIDQADRAKVGTIVSDKTHEMFGLPAEVYTADEHAAFHDASFKAQVLLRNIAERHNLYKYRPRED
jgi:hypothetical protein